MEGMPKSSSTESSMYSMSSTGPSTFDFTKPTPSAGMGNANDMGDMGNKGDMGDMGSTGAAETTMGNCKLSMLWNWETIDACFLTESWQIRSNGAFAALCIGVVLLVVLLELLRRIAKIYDRYLVRQYQKSAALAATAVSGSTETADGALIAKERPLIDASSASAFRPNVWQQAVRALLHALYFALAYWIMLLAMYYNGYVIISIIIGAYIGFFACQWERIGEPR
ncbi:Ctr-domain-containing protein [Hypoxylon sp. NC1633]|nr:Ctr-domain-containing protein [Hypoxylon sp. NC1633]